MPRTSLMYHLSLPLALVLILAGCASVATRGDITTPPQQAISGPAAGTASSACRVTFYKSSRFWGGENLVAGTYYLKVTANGVVLPATNYIVAVICNTNQICADYYDPNERTFTGPAWPKYAFTVGFTPKNYPAANSSVVLKILSQPAP